MTLQEFKAWFDGFTEAIDKGPTQKQWARIKERVAEIDGTAITERIYVDRYRPAIRPYWTGPYWASGTLTSGGLGQTVSSSSVQLGASNQALAALTFNSIDGMYALGAAEAQNIN